MDGSNPDGLWSIVTLQSEDIRLARCNGLFPLTLTLSLGEREQRALRSGKPTIVDCSPGRERFTFSPREVCAYRDLHAGGGARRSRRFRVGHFCEFVKISKVGNVRGVKRPEGRAPVGDARERAGVRGSGAKYVPRIGPIPELSNSSSPPAEAEVSPKDYE